MKYFCAAAQKLRRWISGRRRQLVFGALLACTLTPALTGCGGNTGMRNFPPEKIAFVDKTDSSSKVMIGTEADGATAPYFMWPGKDMRYYFSDDGKYFSAVMLPKNGIPYTVIASTDGSNAWYAPYGAAGFSFSPASTKLVSVTTTTGNPNNTQLGIFDVASGSGRVLTEGKNINNPIWVNDKTVLYNESSAHLIYSIDITNGEKRLLSPQSGGFILYPINSSAAKDVAAIIHEGTQPSIWSLNLRDSSMKQVTNNDRNPVQSVYLPDTNTILFTESPERNTFSAEICLVNDDGGDFSMLTRDFDFDGNFSVSPSGGRIAYHHLQQADSASWKYMPGGKRVINPRGTISSIWVVNPDGSNRILVASKSTGSLEQPGFAPVTAWMKENPLSVDLSGGTNYTVPVKISISNPTDAPVEAVVREFPGANLQLTPTTGQKPDVLGVNNISESASQGLATRRLEWKITLLPGRNQVISVTPSSNAQTNQLRDGTLLVTISVKDAQPLMFWQNLG